ncbi:MAG TPA: FAD-binding oxidoreductase, partial [Acidimicrobiales bacterium]|nr:FAD-binding oxidoreductase [Acidimicrobiales bacterium]
MPEVVVVGAGVVGASTAFHLVSQHSADVLVVEQGAVASGMSSRSSALVRMHYSFGPEVELAVRSDAVFARWPDVVGRPHFVRRTGFARIARPAEEAHLRANVAMQRRLGADTRLVDSAELAQLAPGLRTDDFSFAAFEPNGGYGDGAVVAGDFMAAARLRGARLQSSTAVLGLLREGDRVVGVTTGSGQIRAGTVVVATGIWCRQLLRTAGVEVPIEGELHHVAHAVHPRGAGAPIACIDSITGTYFRPGGSGEATLVGTFRGKRPAVAGDALASGAIGEFAANVAAASHRLPALAEAGVTGGVTGVYDMTPDGRPLLGRVPGVDGLVVAVGFSGMGFKISPAVGEAIAAVVAGDGPDWIDLKPFR